MRGARFYQSYSALRERRSFDLVSRLARYSGKASDTTIAKVLQRFAQIGLLQVLPKARENFRDVNHYRFTPDSPKFQTMLSSVHERLRTERDKERTLRSELRVTASSNRSTNPKGNPKAANPYPGKPSLHRSGV